MNMNKTEIVVVMDRSGSMESCKTDAEGGLNRFVEEQRKVDGEVSFSLVQFDTDYEFVYNGAHLSDVKEIKLNPRGWTALLDAVGKAINETGERLATMDEDDRPGLVVFVIVTDGQENSSKEFSKSQIREMIERQQNEWNWKFTFLGADQDAFAEAGGLGICAKGTSNYAKSKTFHALSAAAGLVARARSATAAGQQVDFSYTNKEIDEMTGGSSSAQG